ncbi:MAG: hypothetical protein LBS36_01095 [Oscillospiraceae bacterium]|nr:hypothetical protein [Oscillospiraceae bacterium]
MKKTVSVLLALVVLFALPFSLSASASETFALTLTLPEGRTAEDLWLIYDEEAFPDLSAIPVGQVFVFELGLHEKYDPYFTTLFANGVVLTPQPDGKYTILMDRNIEITCPLSGGLNFRLKTFAVSNPSGDGYRVRPEAALGFQNYRVEWGGDYVFRVILLDDYKGAYVDGDYENSRISVSVYYYVTVNGEQEEVEILAGEEGLEFLGTDTDGSPLFRVSNIKNDMYVRVGMMMSDSMTNIIKWMKDILRLLMNLFTGGGSLSDIIGGLGGLMGN